MLSREEKLKRKREYQKNYRVTHKSEIKEYNDKYEQEHPEIRRKCTKNWQTKNKEQVNALARKSRQKRVKEVKKQVFDELGNECSNPYNIDHHGFEMDEDYFKALQIDHVNGDGVKDRGKKRNQGYYLYIFEKLKSGSKDYQLLCPTCNWLKRIKNKESN